MSAYPLILERSAGPVEGLVTLTVAFDVDVRVAIIMSKAHEHSAIESGTVRLAWGIWAANRDALKAGD